MIISQKKKKKERKLKKEDGECVSSGGTSTYGVDGRGEGHDRLSSWKIM